MFNQINEYLLKKWMLLGREGHGIVPKVLPISMLVVAMPREFKAKDGSGNVSWGVFSFLRQHNVVFDPFNLIEGSPSIFSPT